MERFSSEEITGPKRSGVFVPIRWAFFYVLLAVLIATVVGLIVNFAVTKDSSRDCPVQANQNSGTLANVDVDRCIAECKTGGSVITTKKALDTTTASSPASSTAPGGDLPSKPIMRLPTSVVPYHYNLALMPDIYKSNKEDFTFNGTVDIKVRCNSDTAVIKLHQNKLNIDSYSLRNADDSVSLSQITNYSYDSVTQFMTFYLSRPLEKGKDYTLSIQFSSKLRSDLSGLYYSSYIDDAGKEKYIATSQMEPTDARKAFPCFDEPAMKANFSVSIWRKEPMKSLSNMNLKESVRQSQDWVVDKFASTPVMSTYLLAFVVCDFQSNNVTIGGRTQFGVWARKESIKQADYALTVGANITSYFEELFGHVFPLPKQDMIAIPDFAAGAMENWGLITYRETAMLYDPAYASASNKQRVATVVSHELAHQWFGNLVSPEWWDDLWLNEGFASYVEYLGVKNVHPDWEMMDQILIEDVFSVKYDDSLSTSHPIYVPVNDPEEINEIFDSISYAKGASIIRQFIFAYGWDVFVNGTRAYFRDKKYENANKGHLWDAWESAVVRSGDAVPRVNEVMDTWTNQMGYPLISVRYFDNGSIEATQQHFLQDSTKPADPRYPSPYGYKWFVPLTVVSDKNPKFNLNSSSITWMKPSENSKKLDCFFQNWFIVNAGSFGYYRVQYENKVWDELTKQLDQNHTVIHENNRAQLIDDAFNLVKAKLLAIDKAMGVTKYIAKEQVYVPMAVALSELSQIDRLLDSSQDYGYFETYMKNIIASLYTTSEGFADVNGHINQLKQSLIVPRACRLNIGDCRVQAKKWFNDWMKNNTSIPVNVRSTAYCYGVKLGDVAEWDFVYDRFKKDTKVPTETAKLLEALSCTEKPWLLQRTLNYSLDQSKIRKQDAVSSIVYVSRNTLGKSLAWNFIRENWELMYREYGGGSFSFSNLVSGALRDFKTQVELEEVIAFGEKYKGKFGSATRAFEQAKERIKNNIDFLARNEKSAIDWLKKNMGASPVSG